MIMDGLDYVDENIFKPNMIYTLNELGYKFVIIPNEDWCPSKWFPTETSSDSREVRVIYSYISKNPSMLGYSDQCGRAFHELVHATIFSGCFPKRFLSLASPYEYPLNTDEIYCYGYQIWKMAQVGKLKDFMKFVIKKIPGIGKELDLLVKVIAQRH